MRELTVRREVFKYEQPFVISRQRYENSDLVVVEIREGTALGRGEVDDSDVVFSSSADAVPEQIEEVRAELEGGAGRKELLDLLPAGCARCAADAALWDLECKLEGKRIWEIAGRPPLEPMVSAHTISVNNSSKMAADAAKIAHRPMIKVKLRGEGDLERMRAVREAAPEPRLIVDANEAWTPEMLPEYLAGLRELGVEMVEQPLPSGADDALAEIKRIIPICADEACQTIEDLPDLVMKYDVINIKLEKCGGLTAAFELADEAVSYGFELMVGTMGGTSLSMAPALMIGAMSRWVDLDGPLLLGSDRYPALTYDNCVIHPPPPELWG
jgi:L-alanine-DL-glutamate epimerase-like enolase superfamily enzyme